MRTTTISIFCGLIFPICAFAATAENLASPNEAKLIGAWQEGRPSNIQDEGRVQGMKAAGALGAVTQFNADHTFTMYPPCGAKKDDLRRAGMQSIKGTWQLTEAGDLISEVEVNGRRLKIETKLTWKDDQMVLLNKTGTVANKSGRYFGSFPPSC